METTSNAASAAPVIHPVDISVPPQYHRRNRLTCAFRPILAIPHLLLVGGPLALAMSWMGSHEGAAPEGSAVGGVLGAVAIVAAIIAWFAIVFTGAFPRGLWKLSAFYLHWRVRAIIYVALLRDEYPPFGGGRVPRPAQAAVRHRRPESRDRGVPPHPRHSPPRRTLVRQRGLGGHDGHRVVRNPLHRGVSEGSLRFRDRSRALELAGGDIYAPVAG